MNYLNEIRLHKYVSMISEQSIIKFIKTNDNDYNNKIYDLLNIKILQLKQIMTKINLQLI